MHYSRKEFILKSSLIAGAVAINLHGNSSKKHFDNDRIVLLGTRGGPFIQGYKPSPAANLLVYKNKPYIIDAGYGVTFKLLDAGINLALIKSIFITHHHSDHNLELGPLLYNAWIAGMIKGIDVYAPIGLKSLLDFYWESNRFDIETRISDEGRIDIREIINEHEFTEGVILENSDIAVTSLCNIHPPIKESYALKFKLGDKVVVFSGDTAYCPALAEFASEADFLIHEVMYGPAIDQLVKRRPNAPSNLKESIISHHTLAEDAGRIAGEARVKNLVLNHFVPADDNSITEHAWFSAVRSTYSGNIIVGKDLMEIPL